MVISDHLSGLAVAERPRFNMIIKEEEEEEDDEAEAEEDEMVYPGKSRGLFRGCKFESGRNLWCQTEMIACQIE